jgi:hypothetical protein
VPTLVQFDGGKTLELVDEFDEVNAQLGGEQGAGQFTGFVSGERVRVTVYRANVAYIQEREKTGDEPPVPTA